MREISRQALAKAEGEMTASFCPVRGSDEAMIRQLEDDTLEYNDFKSGKLSLPKVERLDQMEPFAAQT